MGWDALLYLSIIGTAVTVALVAVVANLGLRYRRELPKLPITRSIEALEEQRANAEVELDSKRTELVDAQDTIRQGDRAKEFLETAKPEMELLQEQMGHLQAEKARAEMDREAAGEALHRLEKIVEAATEEAKSREAALLEAMHEHARLTGQVDGLREQHDALLRSIEELKKVHSSAGGISDDHDAGQDLWQAYFKDRVVPGGIPDEVNRLESMWMQLEGANVHISKRTLYAFHTALKVQDISPLTVLAGISGTGKSLLPSLYAKCMGVHFLNLPVQPGWNSPQDLFGFYNYIEQSFKATALSRSLVQFDLYSRSIWSLPESNVDLSDQVLLVLLDEMNLARVEYYFSELLSRLEMRRTIDPSVPSDRMKVSIPIDLGHAQRGEGERSSTFSLYPGNNILFAGTMNEDESTMSLSDKVLDRATVLRFGRPSTMVTKVPLLDEIAASEPLALATWKSWHRHEDSAPWVRDRVQSLSDIMSKAGSPFGHRVAQGMIRYVEQYPDRSTSGQEKALIDQIEQKVLPKLRGQELGPIAEPLNQLKRLVNELHDAALVRALDEGMNPEQTDVFMWRGLDRKEATEEAQTTA